jgi:hypothetical protein
MTAPVRTIGGIVLLLILFLIWYSVAADYSYGSVSGSYSFRINGEESILVLRKDQSFQQEVKSDGRLERSQGTWRRIGEGGVVLSKSFMKLPGQEIRPDGQVYGVIRKRFGLFPSIVFDPNPGGPVFRKTILR